MMCMVIASDTQYITYTVVVQSGLDVTRGYVPEGAV